MDLKARAIAALREQPPLDWHRWHDFYRKKRDRLRRERAERDSRMRIRLTKTGWAIVALAVAELVYIGILIHEHQTAAPLRPAAVQKGSVAHPGGR